MKKEPNKKIHIISGGLLICLLVFYVLSGLIIRPSQQTGANLMQINLYFLNMANSNIEREIRNIETPTSNTELINAVLRELIKGPENNWLYRTIPRDVTIEVAELTENEKLCEITLSPEYTLLPVKDEIFCRSSLVWTLTEFDFIDDVVIYVSGQQLQGLSGQAAGVMNRENLSVNPVLSPHRPNSQTITLYFANADLSALTPEARTIEVTNTIEYHIVEQLIKGPVKEGVNPTLLPEIKLKATDTLEGICYVDFGPEFLSRQLTGNMSADALVIGSIVNSLTELSSVTMVQIIVDSNTVTGVWGGYDLSIPVSRDENVIE